MVSEAGGLVGNFTGDADFLHRQEVIAGNPKIYGQLVRMLGSHFQRRGRPCGDRAGRVRSVRPRSR